MNSYTKGKKYELIASRFLKTKKFVILKKNYIYRNKEIDIICRKDYIIHFVEVKGRKSEEFSEIADTISAVKKLNLIYVASHWLIENNFYDCDWQIDFIGIVDKNLSMEITYIPNAITCY